MTRNAASAETAGLGAGPGLCSWTAAGRGSATSVVDGVWTPRFASPAKAVVISSSVTSEVPSASEGTGARWLVMPIAWATSVTRGRPTSWAMRTAGRFSESSSARRTVTVPWKR